MRRRGNGNLSINAEDAIQEKAARAARRQEGENAVERLRKEAEELAAGCVGLQQEMEKLAQAKQEQVCAWLGVSICRCGWECRCEGGYDGCVELQQEMAVVGL